MKISVYSKAYRFFGVVVVAISLLFVVVLCVNNNTSENTSTEISKEMLKSSKPIIGYDKVKWGVSVEGVRKAYGIDKNISLIENYEGDPDIAALTQENVSESIEKRQFLFNKWNSNKYKLYRVWVDYKSVDDNTLQNLQNLLTGKFGFTTDQTTNKLSVFVEEEVYTYGQYSPELVVELIRTSYDHFYKLDKNGQKIIIENPDANMIDRMFLSGGYYMSKSHTLKVCYTWKKFRDEYKARNVGL